MEAGLEEDVPYVCDFEEGDKVVYPHHGAGIVLKKESRELMGEKREYLTIKILHNELTVMVPCENAGIAGLRRVIDEDEIKKVTDVLTDDVSEMPKNWNRRFKYNREKIKTGDVFELAEVVRNLAIREMEKGLSTGEKQMYTRAKKILASEFMYALDKDEEGAEEYLDGLLEERFAATRLAPPRHRGHRGRRLRGEARSRRPEGLRAARRAADGRVVDRGLPRGRASRRSSSPCPPATATSRRWSSRTAPTRPRRRSRCAFSPAARPARSRSSNALEAVETELVAIHDAARPLLTPELIEGVVATLERRPRGRRRDRRHPGHRHDQAGRAPPRRCIGVRRRASMQRLVVEETLDRAELWAAQTPQVFRVEALRAALAADPERVAAATDEAMLVEAAGGRVLIHPVAGGEPQGDDGARPAPRRAAARERDWRPER